MITSNFYLFLLSVVFISLSGILMPGPLLAVTLEKAAKSKTAGVLIAVGHGLVEIPLMVLIFFVLSHFQIFLLAEVLIGIIGGLLMLYIGFKSYKNRSKFDRTHVVSKSETIFSGVQTTAVNPGFILWCLTVGTALIINAQQFGLGGFSLFAGVHWSCDFLWYSLVALLIFKSQKFWNKKVTQGISLFCSFIFIGFGAWFLFSSLWQSLSMFS